MQLRAVSMAILGVGATVAVLNMAFHPLARMGALTHDNSDLRAHRHRNRTQGLPLTAAQDCTCNSPGALGCAHHRTML